MGAKTFSVAAIAAVGWTLAASAQPSAPPKPGTLETYRDWTIGCDNRNRCEAVSLLPENGDWPDNPVTVGVVRDPGADGATEVWTSRDARGTAEVAFQIDGRKVASATGINGEATVRGPQAAALAIAMARGGVLEVRVAGKVVGRPSLSGSGAALRYMDARQGRAGTSTALVATGPLGPGAVRVAPILPLIRRVAIAGGALPPALWREELTALGAFTGCADEMKGASSPELHRLSKTETLVLVPCGAGAYNVTSVPVIATGVPGRRTWRLAPFDYEPGWGEGLTRPELVNAGWTPDKSRLDSFAKGRGIGDCGDSAAYVWDGARFRLIESATMGECRGTWHWITTWTARVGE